MVFHVKLHPVFALALLGLSGSAARVPSFEEFVELYGRTYKVDSAEYATRRAIYEQRAGHAKSHNSIASHRWTAAANKFWDWTDPELDNVRGWHGGARPKHGHFDHATRTTGFSLEQSSVSAPLPKAASWTSLQAMKHIKDQGECGSCWAIAVAVVMQAHAEIHAHLPNRTFSTQELVSCVPNPDACGGDGGCKGATAELALEYVQNHGLATEEEFPYRGVGSTCPHSFMQVKVEAGSRQLLRRSSRRVSTRTVDENADGVRKNFGMKSFVTLPQNSYEPLKRALAEKGPVVVSVAAGGKWFSYGSGVFDQCDSVVINHAVVAVGYGVDAESSLKFWTIQNSWGKTWGEAGFIRVVRGDDETNCGVDHQPELGTGCRGGPKEVTVCGSCGILYDTALPLLDDL